MSVKRHDNGTRERKSDNGNHSFAVYKAENRKKLLTQFAKSGGHLLLYVMKQEKYEEVIVANDLEYEFTSVSPNKNITKCLQLNPTQNPEIVNLLFGNKREDGSIDDLARDNNRDRNKILATIVYIISLFTKEYPEKWIFFAGSTPERTRLYGYYAESR